jgi:hypothetical protein
LGDWVVARPNVTRTTRNFVFAETTLIAGPRSLLTASAVFKTLGRRRDLAENNRQGET